MRCPSVKKLCETFKKIDSKQANLIRKLAHSVDYPDDLEALIDAQCPTTAAYVRRMYNSPYNSHMWRVTVALHAMDAIMGTYGVESLGPASDDGTYAPPYEYLNTGDSYAATLVYKCSTDSLFISSWGEIAEKHSDWA